MVSRDAADGADDRTGSGTAEPGASGPPAAPDTPAAPSVGSEEDALAQLEYEDALAELEYEGLLARLENDGVLSKPDAGAGGDQGEGDDQDEDDDEGLRLDDDQLAELSYDAGLDEIDADEGTGDADDEGEGEDGDGRDGERDSDSHGEVPPAPVPPVDFHELHDMGEGDVIVRVDVWATAAFALVAALTAAFPDALVPVFVPLSLLLFLGGCVAFMWAFARGVARSRFEAITMGGLFFLTEDVAPARIRRALRSTFGVQVVVAVAAALVRPFTPLAFGTLVPLLGLGLIALWAARHGEFPPKAADD